MKGIYVNQKRILFCAILKNGLIEIRTLQNTRAIDEVVTKN